MSMNRYRNLESIISYPPPKKPPLELKEIQREVCQHSKRRSYLCSCNDAYKL